MIEAERVETVIVGGGQAGLSVGYHMARRGLPFVILDANRRIGDAWRSRWDSLRLFTPAMYNGLDGMPFPGPGHSFPTKDQMADYLEAYATRFELPVRTGVRVERLFKQDGRFVVTAGERRLEADQVVVAMANYQQGKLPPFAKDLGPDIVQLHSSEYKNPAQLREGGVLVVGAANSGVEIALDVSRRHSTWLSGRYPGHVPFRIAGLGGRFLVPMVWFWIHRVATVDTPIGRKLRRQLLHRAGTVVRVWPEDIDAAGIERVPRVVGVRDGQPVLADERLLEVENVIWCTGFHADFSWIDLPVFGDVGDPLHDRGIVESEPGLYFVGLFFLSALSSSAPGGVGRDAQRIVECIASRNHSRGHAESSV